MGRMRGDFIAPKTVPVSLDSCLRGSDGGGSILDSGESWSDDEVDYPVCNVIAAQD